MESQLPPLITPDLAMALLEWQAELGATEAIGDGPINRYELAQEPRKAAAAPTAEAQAGAADPRTNPAPPQPAPMRAQPGPDAVAQAKQAATSAQDLAQLRAALDGFNECALKRGARSLVFADGVPGAPVMIIGEAPGREEDRAGLPFVGPAGQLLDRMLAAIDLSRQPGPGQSPVYITNVLPWRPPQNRDPNPNEIAMMVPFLQRHIELAAPKLLVVMGNISAQAMLGQTGITRLRGTWASAMGLPCLPMFHPAYLLRQPAAKRQAWADLLALKAQLTTTP
jgi:uracil-DNA glycosylase family 4